MKLTILFLLAASSAWGQTNVATTNFTGEVSNSPPEILQTQTNQNLSDIQLAEQVRAACIQGRRSICGRVLKLLPDGLVVESGYTNLLRSPLDRSWLVPGTAVASRSPDLIEGSEPGSMCVGLIFLTDYPKSRRAPKPKLYDYVIIDGYPAGQYTYTSVGSLQRTVRRFSASISEAVKINLPAAKKQIPSAPPE